MALGTTEAIKRAVAAGVGVAIVSRLSIGLELQARTLAMVRVAGLSIRRDLVVIRRKERSASDALKAFLALLPAVAPGGSLPRRPDEPARKSARRVG